MVHLDRDWGSGEHSTNLFAAMQHNPAGEAHQAAFSSGNIRNISRLDEGRWNAAAQETGRPPQSPA
jgi:hypothetical protein